MFNVLIVFLTDILIVLTGADHNVHIWDLSNGTLVSRLSKHTDSVISLAFSREGNVLASGNSLV